MWTHNLELDRLSLQLDCPNLEVYANGANVTLRVCIVGETKEQAGLLPRTSQLDDFESGHGAPTLPTPESPMRRSLKR